MTPDNDPEFTRMMSELFDDLVAMHGRKVVRAVFGRIDDDDEPGDVGETD